MAVSPARLLQLLGNFQPARFALAERIAQTGLAGTRIEKLNLVSQNGEKVRAFLAGPDHQPAPLPAILHVHAHGNRYDIGASELVSGRTALQAPPYAQTFAQAGFVSFCIDLPCFGERAGEAESTLAKSYLWHGKTLFGAMLAELSGALSLMKSLQEIDGERIGTFGISMGATLAFWLGAIDVRIKSAAHLCCFADLGTLVESGAHDLHGIYMTVPNLLNHARTGEIAGLMAPRPQLACMGLADPLTPPGAVERGLADLKNAYSSTGTIDALETLISPDTGHAETPQMRDAVINFFRRTLA